MFDVIIIGGGPAGLTAAIYTARRALNTLVLTKDIGGQAAKTYDIENYPGVKKISGFELANTMKEQAESFGTKILFENVEKIKKDNELFTIVTNSNKYEAKSIILAFGKKPRELNAKGEKEFLGKGVSYCATCDAPFFKDKIVTIVGGGNSALDAAILCSKLCKKVYIIHRRDNFSGEQALINQVIKSEKIEIIFKDEVEEIIGKSVVESIRLKSGKEIETNGVIVEIGYIVDRTLVKDFIKINEQNQIIIDQHQETSVDGIFAAGDLTTTLYKQIIVSAGEGAKAALSAYDFIQKKEGKRGIRADWH